MALKTAPVASTSRSGPNLYPQKAYGAGEIVEVNYNLSLLAGEEPISGIYCFIMPNSAARSGRVRTRQRRRLGRALPRIIIAAAVGWVLFFGYYIYRETSNDDQRAIANCIEEQNRNAVGSSGREAAAIAAMCAHRPASQ